MSTILPTSINVPSDDTSAPVGKDELRSRLSELERFCLLLDQSGDTIFLVSGDNGDIVDAYGTQALLGRPRREFIGQSVERLFTPKASGKFHKILVRGGGRVTLDTDIASLCYEGRNAPPVEMNVRIMILDGRKFALVLARDISQRKEAEQALRLAEEKYRSIFEHAVEGIFQTTLKGAFISANPALAEMLGYGSPKELTTRVLDLPSQLYADPGARAEFLVKLERFGAVRNFETRFIRHDGSRIWASINARRAVDRDGETEYIEGSIIDITNRKLSEEQIFKAHFELEQRVEERTSELTRANRQLHREVEQRTRTEERYRLAKEQAEAASRAKTEFLSLVSHELRTPLTSIFGFAKIIDKKLKKNLQPALDLGSPKVGKAFGQIAENVDIIVREGQRLTELINDLLDLSKYESGQSEFVMGPVDVGEVVRQAMSACRPLFREKSVELVSSIPQDIPAAMADKARLLQVVINLLSNAAKFTDHGKVECFARHENEEILVRIVDTGIGIPAESLEDIFEKFRQVGDHLTDRPKGTGLGLPICRQIVSRFGGRIWAQSNPGQGSVFNFTLPLVPDKAGDPDAPKGPAGPNGPDGPNGLAGPDTQDRP